MEQKNRRATGLDGLRGAAAATVALNHFFNLFPANGWTSVWKYSPLYVLIVGHEAVLIFFLLSGFALSQMVDHAVDYHYRRFAVRRIVRIYGPYLFALALAVAGDVWLSKGGRAGFSHWFNRSWMLPVKWSDVVAHVLFLGDFDTERFNSAFWSLVHEMRISLIFPLLYWLVQKWPGSWALGFAVAVMVAGTLLNPVSSEPNNPAETLHYSGFFIAGIVIAMQRRRLSCWYVSMSNRQRTTILIGAALLFYYGRAVALVLPMRYSNGIDIPIGIGAALIMIFAGESAFFTKPWWQWLGKRSYSLYLIHAPVLFALVNILNLSKPSLTLLLAYAPLTLAVTEFFYLTVERPLLVLSRRAG